MQFLRARKSKYGFAHKHAFTASHLVFYCRSERLHLGGALRLLVQRGVLATLPSTT